MDLPRPHSSNDEAPQRVRFGRFTADLGSGELRVDGKSVAMQPQPRRLLLHLIRHRHRVVSRQELLEEVFGGREVSTAALARAITKARAAIEQEGSDGAVAAIPRVGFRFVAKASTGALAPGEDGRSVSVALLPFDDATNDAASAWVRSGLPSLVGEMLESDRRISLITMPSVLGAVADAPAETLAQRVARLQQATGAAAVVHAHVAPSPSGLQVDFRLFAGRRLATGSVTEAQPADLALAMAKAVGALLGCTIDDAAAAAQLPKDPLAAEAYFRGRQAAADERLELALHLFQLAHAVEPDHTATALSLLQRLAARAETRAQAHGLAAELIRRAESANDRATLVRIHYALAHGQLTQHLPEEAAANLDRVMALADGREGAMFWSNLYQLHAIVAHARSRHAQAREHLARSRQFCLDAGHRGRLLWLMLYEAGLVTPEEGVELAMKAARGARQIGRQVTIAGACNNASKALSRVGRLAEAVSYAAEGFAAAAAIGDRSLADSLAECSAFACRLAGWPAIAERTLADLDAMPGAPYHEHFVLLARGFWHGSRGEWTQAAGFTGRALDRVPFAALRAYVLPWHAEALMFSGREDEAQALIDNDDPTAYATTEYKVHPLLMRAALAHRRGECDAALAWLGEAVALGPSAMWHTWACVDIAWLNAEAGRSDEAARALARIDAGLAALPVVMATRARVRHAAGDVQGAAALHRRHIAARKEPGWNPYFEDLAAEYDRQAREGLRPLPPSPFLPSRSC